MLSSNEEYDFDMKLTKIYKNKEEIKWINFLEYSEEYICKGNILRLYGFNENEEYTDLLFFDPSEEDCSLGVIILSGKKSGNIFVYFPFEARYNDTRLMSKRWLINNWSKWLSPSSDIKKSEFIYEFVT